MCGIQAHSCPENTPIGFAAESLSMRVPPSAVFSVVTMISAMSPCCSVTSNGRPGVPAGTPVPDEITILIPITYRRYQSFRFLGETIEHSDVTAEVRVPIVDGTTT